MKDRVRYVHDPHLKRSFSVLALNGTAGGTLEELDGFCAAGGNALHIHEEGGGTQMRADLGRWLHERDQPRNMLLCCYIGHDGEDGSVRKDPSSLGEDIVTHLSLLEVDTLDLVYLDPPRENARVPQVLDTLAEHVRAGRIGGYGLRNWTAQQIRLAMNYTSSSKLPPPLAVITTELSSAVPTNPLWDEYIVFDGALREVIKEFDLTVWAWLTDINQPLFVPPEQRSAFMTSNRMQRWITEDNDRIVSQLSEIAERAGQTLRQANARAVLGQDLRVVGIISRDAANHANLGEFYEIAS